MLSMVIFDWYNQYSIADPIVSATVLHTGLHSAILSTLLTLIHSHPLTSICTVNANPL